MILALIGLMLFTTAGGCCAKFDRHPVSVALGPALQANTPRIEVHIFAANAQESKEWESISMSQYWGRNNLERSRHGNDMVSLIFGSDKPQAQDFTPQVMGEQYNRLWNLWEKQHVTNLFIFANLPNDPAQPFPDKNGSADARRLVIPVSRCRWENKEQPIQVTLTPAKVLLSTPMKDEK
jgi:hypothetical protein